MSLLIWLKSAARGRREKKKRRLQVKLQRLNKIHGRAIKKMKKLRAKIKFLEVSKQ